MDGIPPVASTLLESALALAADGYLVFRLSPGIKKPPLGSHGFKEATLDADQIRRWWTENPHYNIGIATAGLMVVDLDPGSDAWWDANHELIEGFPIVRTPRGGRHVFMRKPTGKPWTIGAAKIATNVDHRSDGGYVVAAPSVVDGVSYRWERYAPAPELPPVPPALIAAFDLALGDTPLLDGIDDISDTLPPGEGRKSETRALVSSGEKIPEGERHPALIARLGWLRRGGCEYGEMLAMARVFNESRFSPPYPDHELAKQCSDFASRYRPDETETAYAEGAADRMWGEGKLPFDAEDIPPPKASRPFPADLLDVPGFIGEMARWNLETAYRPQPILAFVGALALQSVLCARKIRDVRGNRTNLYLIGTGVSGCGKDHILGCNTSATLAAKAVSGSAGSPIKDVDRLLFTGDPASDAGLIALIKTQPNLLLQWDEFGRVLQSIMDQRASHLYACSTSLVKLYSCAKSIWTGKAYADSSKNITIVEPCVSLLGVSVPGHVYKALTPESLSDGLLARMMIFEGDSNPQRIRGAMPTDPPSGVVEAILHWVNFSPDGNLSGGVTPSIAMPRVVPIEDAAWERLYALGELVDATPKDEDSGGAVFARAEEKAHRLALCYACSENPERPIVTVAAMDWACRVAEYSSHRMMELAQDWLANSDFDRLQKRVLRCISRTGRASASDLCRALRDVPTRQRDEVINNLVACEQITRSVEPTNGRFRTIYRAAPNR